MQIIKKLQKGAAVVLSAALLSLFTAAGYYSNRLPGTVTAENGTALKIAGYPEISCTLAAAGDPGSDKATLSLFGAIPVKSVSVSTSEAPELIVGGMPFGIKLLMDGVMVTGLGKVDGVCPAENAGIQTGDILRLANGVPISSNADLQKVIADSKGKSVRIELTRNNVDISAELNPVKSSDSGKWRGGMWVRDSIAGIGTVTFINKATGEFAGLGHPVCDADTGELVPIHSGEAVPVDISDVRKGANGIPGELHGNFKGSDAYGVIDKNTNAGIFGRLTNTALDHLCNGSESFKIAYRQNVKKGEAFIYTSVCGSQPERYTAEIESIDYNGSETDRNMMIRITDQRLLDATGGIVQGMSGSPIIQDERIVGAVTHVFVADPTRGYAIFAENMLSQLSESQNSESTE